MKNLTILLIAIAFMSCKKESEEITPEKRCYTDYLQYTSPINFPNGATISMYNDHETGTIVIYSASNNWEELLFIKRSSQTLAEFLESVIVRMNQVSYPSEDYDVIDNSIVFYTSVDIKIGFMEFQMCDND